MPTSELSKQWEQAGLPQKGNAVCVPLVAERPKSLALVNRADLLFSPALRHDWYLAVLAAFNARFF
jgi:hypothetical protein